MKKFKKLLALSLAMFMTISGSLPALAFVSQPKNSQMKISTEREYVPGEVIVRFKEPVKNGRVAGGISMETLFTWKSSQPSLQSNISSYSKEPSPVLVLARSGSLSTEEMISKLLEDPNVEYAEPNYIRKLELPDFGTYSENDNNALVQSYQSGVNTIGSDNSNNPNNPNDPYLSRIWFMDEDLTKTPGAIDIKPIWEKSQGSKDIIVAVLDTGIDVHHQDLKANINTDLSYNAISGNKDISDEHGHGTHVAGTIGGVGNNRKGISGINQQVTIMGVKVADDNGSILAVSSIKGLSHVYEEKKRGRNIKVVNMSYGGNDIVKSEIDMVRTLANEEVTVVIASGNEKIDSDLASQAYMGSLGKNIIKVNAISRNGKLVDFSNYGEANTQICAPGEKIFSTVPSSMASMGDIMSGEPLQKDDFSLYSTGGGFGMNVVSGSALTNNTNTLVWNIEEGNTGDAVIFNQNPLDLSHRDEKKPTYITLPLKQTKTSQQVIAYFMLGMSIKSSKGEWIDKGERIIGTNVQNSNMTIKLQPNEDINWSKVSFKFSVKVPKEFSYGKLELTLEPGVATDEALAYMYSDGTSMATPIVAGSVALLHAVYPNESSEQISARIIGGAKKTEDLEGTCVSGGQLNLRGAMDPVPVLWEVEESEDTIVLNGKFFGSTKGTLKIDGKEASVSEWKDDQIIFDRDPQMISGIHRLAVTEGTGKIGSKILDISGKSNGEYDILPAIDHKALGFDIQFQIRSMVATNGNLYVLGSSLEGNIALLRYSIDERKWSVEADIVFKDQQPFAMAVIGQYIYFLTTSQKGKCNYEIMAYDTINKSCRHQKTVDVPKEIRKSATYWAENGYFFVAGGSDSEENSCSEVYKIGIRNGILDVLPDLKTPRRYPTAMSDGSKMTVFGGYQDQSYKMVPGGEFFDGTNWIESDAPNIYEEQELCFALGKLSNGYILAGAQYGKYDLRNMLKYDTTTHKWIQSNGQLGNSKLKIPIGTSCDGKFYVHAVKDVGAKTQNVFYSVVEDTSQIPYNLVTEGDAFGTILLPETAKSGEHLTVKVYPKSGYELDTIYLNGSPISSKEFFMPSQPCYVKASFRPATK